MFGSSDIPRGWGFHNPVEVRFGPGSVEAGAVGFPWSRALLVTTAGMVRRGTSVMVRNAWKETEILVCDAVMPNPQLEDLDALATAWRGRGIEGVVALGGGSALDTGKVLGVLLGTPERFTLRRHFLEKEPLPASPPLPVVAIPTTSGTGSEVTPFATVWDAAQGMKYSLASPAMFPRAALLDPTLTYDLPWDVTVATGLDALCQGLESVWNRHATPISLELAMRGALQALTVLRQGRAVLESPELREQLMGASLLSGFAISQTRTALCHAISYPVTARFGVPHGVACGFAMPAVLEYNLTADDGRLEALARQLDQPSVSALVDALQALLESLEVPDRLRCHGVTTEAVVALASEMIVPGRSDNNLRAAEEADVAELLGRWLPRLLVA